MPKCVRSFRVWRVSSQRIRSADFNASTARGDKSERLPMGVPTMRSFPGTRRSLLQALLFGVIEKETQLIAHAARQLGDARKSEGSARSLQLMRNKEEVGKRVLESVV